MSPALILAFKKKKELTLRALRPCVLTWPGGNSVLAREGVSEATEIVVRGGVLIRMACKFYVLRELLPVVPAIGTVFWIEGRPDVAWKLDKIRGQSPNDVSWIFECVEEHRG